MPDSPTPRDAEITYDLTSAVQCECGTVLIPAFAVGLGLIQLECTIAPGDPQYDFWCWAIRQPEYRRFVEERELPTLVEAWFFSPDCKVSTLEQCGFDFDEPGAQDITTSQVPD